MEIRSDRQKGMSYTDIARPGRQSVFTSNKTFSQWNEVFADVTIVSAILDRVLHHCSVIHIKGESYRLKERKEFIKQKHQILNTLFEQNV